MRSKTPFLILILASVLAASLPAEAPIVAEKAPDFTITDIDGNTFTLSDHRSKVVLIDFFTTSGAPCIQMQPVLREIRDNFAEDELVMISVSVGSGDTVEDIREFRSQHSANWVFAKDTLNLGDSYDIHSVPTEFIINVNGYIHYTHVGTTTAGVLSDEIEEARTGYVPPEFPYALIAIVILVVVGVVSATVAALFWRKRD
ncbi:MAG: TlpA family protein disulfide reductase [Thermoplasmata archaeon]